MDIETIYEKNQFLEEVLEDIRKIVSKVENISERKKLSNKENYIIDTFVYTSKFADRLRTLDYCIAFLNSYPKTKLWEKYFNRSEYIRYHFNNYYININSLFDRALLLTNFIYQLGIKDTHVRYDLIKTNFHLSHTNTKKQISNFYSLLEKTNLKGVRNLITHRGEFYDEKLDELDRYELVVANKKIIGKNTNFYRFLLKLKYPQYVSKKKKEVRRLNKAVLSVSDAFLNSLKLKYIDVRESL